MTSTVTDWLNSSLQQQVSIWCEDPEMNTEKIARGVLEKTYLTYRILYKQIGRDLIAVRHRYSEFETMRVELRDRYHPMGILVPSLPPKKTLSIESKFSDNFVKERTLGLTLFCESVANSPWLKNDTVWKTFMRPNNISGASEDNKNGGEQQLINCLQYLDLPYKFTMAQRMEDIKQEITMIERQVRYVLEKVRGLQTAERNLATCQDSLKQALEGWYDAERLHVKSLGGKIFDEHEPVVKPHENVLSTIQNFNATYGVRVSNEKDNGLLIGLTFSTVLEYELSNCESFKELFKLHDEMNGAIDSLTNKIGKLENSRASQTNIKNYELLQDLKRQLSEKQDCLQAFYKGFVYFTIPLMARVRSYYYRRLLSGYMTSQYTSSYCMYQACFEFYEKAVLNPHYTNDETSRMFELLGMKALAKLPMEDTSDEEDEVSQSVAVDGGVSSGLEKLSVSNSKAALRKRLSTSFTAPNPYVVNKSGQQFVLDESYLLNGLFERGLAISKGKAPATSSTSNSTGGGGGSAGASAGTAVAATAHYAPTTHLFTSSIMPNAVDNLADYNAANDPLSPSNPLARRSSAITKSSTTGGGGGGGDSPNKPVNDGVEHLSIPHAPRGEVLSTTPPPVPTEDSSSDAAAPEDDLFMTSKATTRSNIAAYEDLLFAPPVKSKAGEAPTSPTPPTRTVGAAGAKTDKSKALLQGLLDGSKQNSKNVWDD